MKNIKRGLSIAIVAAMVLGMTACGGSGKTESAGKAAEKKSFSLKLSHYRAEGSPADINAKEFADNVKAADDSLEVVVYPAAQLGDYTAAGKCGRCGDADGHPQLHCG